MQRAMLSCECLYWHNSNCLPPSSDPKTFSLPSPVPEWPPGKGFASGRINLGELEVTKISTFEFIWGYNPSQDKKKGFSFYKPVGIPDGFHCLGHYCQSNSTPLRGFVLVGGETGSSNQEVAGSKQPVLAEPLDYTLVWSSNDLAEGSDGECGYFWLPQPPEGYKSLGYVVTNSPQKPKLHEVRCARADLTDKCEVHKIILNTTSRFLGVPFWVWRTRPSDRGMWGKGVFTGTFFCKSYEVVAGEELDIACLRNLDSSLQAMPNIDQIHALIQHYGPRVFFHPDETYLPSSVSWLFKNGALLFRKGDSNSTGETIDENGSNLPPGGTNDKEFWIDLPSDNERRNTVKRGNLQSAKLYAHVKPAFGGTFTDIAFWVFCPFNGPANLKLGLFSVSFARIGQHVGDWEHFTLRISNFTGELYSIYFSQHSGGEWVEAYDLEYIQGNRAIVYSSKHGHASFSRPGTYVQGSSKLGIGIRNDAGRSRLFVDSNIQYEIVAAEYLGEGVVREPGWLQFMREWGPAVVYDSRTEIDRIINRLPWKLRRSVTSVFSKLPVELSGEEGPTGPKEKNNWFGDERW